jgi:hypothetical protein
VNRTEYEALRAEPARSPVINLADLTDRSDRTLIYGYCCNRLTFHVYLQGGRLIRYIYGEDGTGARVEILNTELLPAQCYVPDKRVYPEASDAAYCRLLKAQGVEFTFTTFGDNRTPRQYHGELAVIEEAE